MGPEELFNAIVEAGWMGVERWVTEEEPEAFLLEFKGRGNASPKLNDFDKDNIAVAASAFANSSGGVLVIGVDTAKRDGVDRAHRLRPSTSPTAYAEAVNRFLLQATDPRVPGARAASIAKPGEDVGVVVVLVPASDGGPHRAKCPGASCAERYHSRTGTSAMVLEHSLLAAMFGRTPPPILAVSASMRANGSPPVTEFRLDVGNTGRGAAREVLVRITDWGVLSSLTSIEPFNREWRRLRTSANGPTGFLHDGAIYPDDQRTVICQAVRGVRVRLVGRVDCAGAAPVHFELDVEPPKG